MQEKLEQLVVGSKCSHFKNTTLMCEASKSEIKHSFAREHFLGVVDMSELLDDAIIDAE